MVDVDYVILNSYLMESIKKKKCLQLFIKKSQSLNKNIIENITKYNKKKLKKIE